MQKTYGKNQVIGILVSDIHLSHAPPIARSCEPDWYEVMKRYLRQLKNIAKKHQGAPIVFAGDMFHVWKSPPELINFALKHLPPMYGIPGQHDLPNHDYGQIRKSAFWTLVESRTITLLEPGKPLGAGLLRLHGFPFGFKIKPNPLPPHTLCFDLAVVHDYIWKGNARFHDAPIKNKYTKFLDKLKTYNAAVFGDNHKGFLVNKKKLSILNNGGFIRRNSDEVNYQPTVGLLLDNGKIKTTPLDTSKDIFIKESILKELQGTNINMESFIDILSHTNQSEVDFCDRVKMALIAQGIKVSKRTIRFINEIMQEARNGSK